MDFITPLRFEAPNPINQGLPGENIISILSKNRDYLTNVPRGARKGSSILHQLVYQGDVGLLKQALVIAKPKRHVLRSRSRSGASPADVAREQGAKHPEMLDFFTNLLTVNEMCDKAASADLVTYFPTLLRLCEARPEMCWRPPENRRWSVAMHVVNSGQVDCFKELLNKVKAEGEDIWTARHCGKTLLDVAMGRVRVPVLLCLISQPT